MIHLRTSPSFHAVTRLDNLIGFGNDPSLTFRQRVGSLKGSSGMFAFGFLERTSCDTRKNALSGSEAKKSGESMPNPHQRAWLEWL